MTYPRESETEMLNIKSLDGTSAAILTALNPTGFTSVTDLMSRTGLPMGPVVRHAAILVISGHLTHDIRRGWKSAR